MEKKDKDTLDKKQTGIPGTVVLDTERKDVITVEGATGIIDPEEVNRKLNAESYRKEEEELSGVKQEIPEGESQKQESEALTEEEEPAGDFLDEGKTDSEKTETSEEESTSREMSKASTYIKNPLAQPKETKEPVEEKTSGLKKLFTYLSGNKKRKRICTLIITFFVVIIMYLTVVYSNIPIIAKWRTIYIETAMSTNSHQWLATLFFPQSVIDEIMAKRKADIDTQEGLASDWDSEVVDPLEGKTQKEFYEKYWELDTDEFREYLEKHEELTKNGYDKILIEDLDGDLGLETVKGDSVVVLDAVNNLLIIAVKGDGYQGKMAIVKDPEQVSLEKSRALGSYGELIDTYGERCNGIVAVNASAFKDVDGEGTGGEVKGSLVIDGTEYGHPKCGDWKYFGLKKNNNRLYVTSYEEATVSEYRWGLEFFPALVVNGENVIDGSFGMGLQPRTTIGQAKNGDFLLLVIDGRQVGHSLGCTVTDCVEVMNRYEVYQAANMDGGSSSVMWYKDRQITSSCSASGNGRYCPDAFVVKKTTE